MRVEENEKVFTKLSIIAEIEQDKIDKYKELVDKILTEYFVCGAICVDAGYGRLFVDAEFCRPRYEKAKQ